MVTAWVILRMHFVVSISSSGFGEKLKPHEVDTSLKDSSAELANDLLSARQNCLIGCSGCHMELEWRSATTNRRCCSSTANTEEGREKETDKHNNWVSILLIYFAFSGTDTHTLDNFEGPPRGAKAGLDTDSDWNRDYKHFQCVA